MISRGYGADCYHPENHGLISVKGTWEQLNSLEAVLRTNTVIITEYSFAAYTHLRAQMSPEGFRQMIDFDFRTCCTPRPRNKARAARMHYTPRRTSDMPAASLGA